MNYSVINVKEITLVFQKSESDISWDSSPYCLKNLLLITECLSGFSSSKAPADLEFWIRLAPSSTDCTEDEPGAFWSMGVCGREEWEVSTVYKAAYSITCTSCFFSSLLKLPSDAIELWPGALFLARISLNGLSWSEKSDDDDGDCARTG